MSIDRSNEASDQGDAEASRAPTRTTASCTHTSLRRAARRLGQFYDDALSPLGMTSPQALMLSQIDQFSAADPLGPPLNRLAADLAIQISALTHALRPLVRDGLVAIHPDPRDGRAKRVVLTEKGAARTHAMYERWEEANQQFEAALGSEAASKLRMLADRVAAEDFLTGTAAPPPAGTRVVRAAEKKSDDAV